MSIFSKEHYELLQSFEREFKHHRLDKEAKDLWSKGHVFQDGHVNELFLAYRRGAAYGQFSTTPHHHPQPVAAPQAREWRELTDEEIRKWWESENGLEDADMCKLGDFGKVVRAISAALKSANGGGA